jgi:hypothetical protein
MDNTNEFVRKKYLVRQKINSDGSVTVTKKLKPAFRRKVKIASGTGTYEPSMADIICSQLQPFKSVMVYQLNKHGFNTSRLAFKDIIALYYNEFVSNKDNPFSQYEPISNYEFRNHVAWKLKPHSNVNGDLKDFHIAGTFDSFNGVVDNIVSIFKTAKLKKRYAAMQGIPAAEALTSDELVQAKAAEKIEKELTAKEKDNKPFKVGQLKTIIIIGIVFFILYKLS